jgi:hypothetical protein
MQFLSRKYEVKPVVANLAAVFTHQEVPGGNASFSVVDSLTDCRRCLMLQCAKKANNVYVSYVCLYF